MTVPETLDWMERVAVLQGIAFAPYSQKIAAKHTTDGGVKWIRVSPAKGLLPRCEWEISRDEAKEFLRLEQRANRTVLI